jgi:hypothetical protein
MFTLLFGLSERDPRDQNRVKSGAHSVFNREQWLYRCMSRMDIALRG